MDINKYRQNKQSPFLVVSVLLFLFYVITPFYQGALAGSASGFSTVICSLDGIQQTVFVEFDDTQNTDPNCLECPACIVAQLAGISLPKVYAAISVTRLALFTPHVFESSELIKPRYSHAYLSRAPPETL